MSDGNLLDQRSAYSQARLTELTQKVKAAAKDLTLGPLTIFSVGSYARQEASVHSDIDLFFAYGEPRPASENTRTNELRLFGRLIEIGDKMGFPSFSSDCEYLETHDLKDMINMMGGREDDSRNFFSLRMLMLLESQPIYGISVYDSIVEQVIASYYRDYPGHEDEFDPWFLVNDIMRFWKTLLLNYEHKRNRGEGGKEATPQRVRNFKLKFSRMTTCFATVAALGCATSRVTEADVRALVKLTPRQRLMQAGANLPRVAPLVTALLEEYSWFIHLTGLTEAELHGYFEEEESRHRMFSRATTYGGMVYELLAEIDRREDMPSRQFMRHLVI